VSTSSSLVVHAGARHVDRAELDAVAAPPATKTWFPLSHGAVLRRVEDGLNQAGFNIRTVRMALSRGNARFFGTLDLESAVATGVTLAVGVRNSIDKSLPIAFCAGSRVFVCDNLAFRSEITVARKHTRFGEVRFGEALSRAVQSLHQFRETEEARVRQFQHTPLTDERAESIMLRAYDQDIVSHRMLPRVLAEWRTPTFEDFGERTLWSLFNAFTTVLGDVSRSNPQRFSALTIALQHLIDKQGVLANAA
jgi:hypothetical protein